MQAVLAILALIVGINFIDKDSTQIVLLDSNKTSSVMFKSAEKSEILNTPNEYLSLSSINQDQKIVLGASELNDKFGTIIKANIDKPISYKLYFTNSDTLDENSIKILPQIRQAIKDRYPCEVSIIGHTDTVGSNDINKKLSLKRAKKVAKIFQDENISRVDIYSFGESNLLVKTADNVFEPKNRRVEIQIR